PSPLPPPPPPLPGRTSPHELALLQARAARREIRGRASLRRSRRPLSRGGPGLAEGLAGRGAGRARAVRLFECRGGDSLRDTGRGGADRARLRRARLLSGVVRSPELTLPQARTRASSSTDVRPAATFSMPSSHIVRIPCSR